MKKLIIVLILIIPFFVNALEITQTCNIEINNKKYKRYIDRDESTFNNLKIDSNLTIECNENITGLYIEYNLKEVNGTISTDNKEITIGNFLHDFTNLYDNNITTNSVKLNYIEDVQIAEIYVFSNNYIPSYVEIWEEPVAKADILLFPTHGDDEHLYFAGIIPTYLDRNKSIQVVYFANHNDNPVRLHEQLHGLYSVGLRNYPVFGYVPDKYSETIQEAVDNLLDENVSKEDVTKNIVQNIRRFKPSVIITHDIFGEYGHGQHKLNTMIVKDAVEKSAEDTYDQETVSVYGTWNTPKTYIHSYKKNKIIMDYDIPLESYNNETAYEISKKGFERHTSQQYKNLVEWLNGKNNEYTTAKEIELYSPCEFGLYRTTVGKDINKDDFLENIYLNSEIVNNNKNNQRKAIIIISMISLISILIIIKMISLC